MEINLFRVSLEGYHGRSDFVVGFLFRCGGRLGGGRVDQRVAASIAVLYYIPPANHPFQSAVP